MPPSSNSRRRRNRKTDEEKQQEKEEADPDLTDTQRKAIDNYDDDTKAFIETLSASVWSANNGTDTLQFTGHTYTETVNGKATEHTYAVTRLEKGTDTAGMEIDTAVFETDTGTHVIRYTCQTGTGEVTDTPQRHPVQTAPPSNCKTRTMYGRTPCRTSPWKG